MTDLRIIFMGTPEFAALPLKALIEKDYSIVGIYTQPPRPAGRGYTLQKSPVHVIGDHHTIDVFTPLSLKKKEEQDRFISLKADLAVVAAYGLLLPAPILQAPRFGCINIHASLLPRWRGAAPIHRALLAGDTETGITIMQMDEGLDTGPILLKDAIPISPQATAKSLHDDIAMLGTKMILKALDALQQGPLNPSTQPLEGVTYAHKIHKHEGFLDWTKDAIFLERQVRAFTPWPSAWFIWQDEIYKVLAAELWPLSGKPGTILDNQLTIACGNQALRPTIIQKQGKKALPLREFLNGSPFPPGIQLPLSLS